MNPISTPVTRPPVMGSTSRPAPMPPAPAKPMFNPANQYRPPQPAIPAQPYRPPGQLPPIGQPMPGMAQPMGGRVGFGQPMAPPMNQPMAQPMFNPPPQQYGMPPAPNPAPNYGPRF